MSDNKCLLRTEFQGFSASCETVVENQRNRLKILDLVAFKSLLDRLKLIHLKE